MSNAFGYSGELVDSGKYCNFCDSGKADDSGETGDFSKFNDSDEYFGLGDYSDSGVFYIYLFYIQNFWSKS